MYLDVRYTDTRPKGEFLASWIQEVDEKTAMMKTVLLEEGRSLSGDLFFCTYGDLVEGNIFVIEEEPGIFKVAAVIDWEFASYYPWCKWRKQRKTGEVYATVKAYSDMSELFDRGRLVDLYPGYKKEIFDKIVDEIDDDLMNWGMANIFANRTPDDFDQTACSE